MRVGASVKMVWVYQATSVWPVVGFFADYASQDFPHQESE